MHSSLSPTGRIQRDQIMIPPLRPSQGKSWLGLEFRGGPVEVPSTRIWCDEAVDYPPIFARRSIAVAAARVAGRTADQWTTEPR